MTQKSFVLTLTSSYIVWNSLLLVNSLFIDFYEMRCYFPSHVLSEFISICLSLNKFSFIFYFVKVICPIDSVCYLELYMLKAVVYTAPKLIFTSRYLELKLLHYSYLSKLSFTSGVKCSSLSQSMFYFDYLLLFILMVGNTGWS